jgi:hypothetical protein
MTAIPVPLRLRGELSVGVSGTNASAWQISLGAPLMHALHENPAAV